MIKDHGLRLPYQWKIKGVHIGTKEVFTGRKEI